MLFNANPRKWNLRIRSFAGWYSVWLSNSYNRNISSECACSLSHQPLITDQFRKPEIVTTSEELKTYPEEGPIRFLTQTGETVMGAWGIAGHILIIEMVVCYSEIPSLEMDDWFACCVSRGRFCSTNLGLGYSQSWKWQDGQLGWYAEIHRKSSSESFASNLCGYRI